MLLDPFRPGVLERLGLAPDKLRLKNPRLIVARLTGYGSTGPYASWPGHDINYAAVSGVLSVLGRAGAPPTPPANLLADFAGGGLTCAMGIILALLARERTGEGQEIEAAMVDGSLYVASFIQQLLGTPLWQAGRGENQLDSGAPSYDTYECADGKWLAVGALEQPFYEALARIVGIEGDFDPYNRDHWPELRAQLTRKIKAQPQAHWMRLVEQQGGAACVTPVEELAAIGNAPHMAARQGLVGGRPAPAPRLKGSPAQPRHGLPRDGQHTMQVLQEFGFSPSAVQKLLEEGAVQHSGARL